MSEAYHLLQRGLAALASGHADEAIVPLERAKKLQPGTSSINEALGQTYFRLRFYERAQAEFEEIIEKEPLDDYAHFCLGRCHDRLGNANLAARHYKLATSLSPERDVYRTTLDRFLARRRMQEWGARQLDEADDAEHDEDHGDAADSVG